MNEESIVEKAKESLMNLLHQKGYRKRFALSVPGSNYPRQYGMLAKCLDIFFKLLKEGRAPSGKLELDTYAPYNDGISCRFKLHYDESGSFKVRELVVHSQEVHQNKKFQFSSNHEIPGSMTLEALFAKPKPWEGIRKGRFRL